MLRMLTDLTKAAVGAATLPVDVAADFITLGGSLTEQPKPYTAQKAERIMDALRAATTADTSR